MTILKRVPIEAPETMTMLGSNARPTIHIQPGILEKLVDQAEAALIAAERGVYQRAGRIVSVGETRVIIAGGREVSGQCITERGEFALLEDFTSAAQFAKYDSRAQEWMLSDAPTKVVKAYQQRVGRWRLPTLTAVISAPTIRPDGSILDRPGYDAETGLLFDPRGVDFPEIPQNPSRGDAEFALDVLRALIETFPFVTEADKSVALSAILTAVSRRSLRTAPMHCFTAPVPGSGKTMLVDIASIIAVGREASVMAQGANEEELEKRLGAALLDGAPVITIDNVEAPLGGDLLCQALTSPVVKVRILGRSEAPELQTSSFLCATGNNLALLGDMTRRALLCSLDPGVERPELQVFDIDPIATAKGGRGRYVAAALTILRAYQVAGQPAQKFPLGSFAEWSRRVRDALLWLGVADPVLTMDGARDADPRMQSRVSILSQWRSVIGFSRVSASQVIRDASAQEYAGEFRHPDFREALLVAAGNGGTISSRSLGKWLSANKNRIVNGLQIMQDGISHGLMTWRLSEHSPQTCI